ncbi:hypothetical protein LJC71_04175 [Desulfosarcina sp. OttesenSCG-928-A07]|nr:hypothetical protein [Desulfosarcina sp. OttesenSCG-928-A07]
MDGALLNFLELLETCGLPTFAEVYGTMPCKWDGGRPIRTQLSPGAPPPVFEQYRKKGIEIYLTFNSNQLTEEDLDDEVGNKLLQEADGVIIASPILNDYIRDKYPNVSRTASCIQSIISHRNKTQDHYKKLCDEYDKVVIGTTHLFNADPERSLDLKFIDQLDRDKIEIMVNDNCTFDCPHRTTHHTLVARHNKIQTKESFQKVVQFFQTYCSANLTAKGGTNLILTNAMIATLKQMGFRHFKLAGRDLPGSYVLIEIVRYIVPERIQPLISMSLSHILQSSAINSFIPVLQHHIKMALASATQPPASEAEQQAILSFVPVLQSHINDALAFVHRIQKSPDAKQ